MPSPVRRSISKWAREPACATPWLTVRSTEAVGGREADPEAVPAIAVHRAPGATRAATRGLVAERDAHAEAGGGGDAGRRGYGVAPGSARLPRGRAVRGRSQEAIEVGLDHHAIAAVGVAAVDERGHEFGVLTGVGEDAARRLHVGGRGVCWGDAMRGRGGGGGDVRGRVAAAAAHHVGHRGERLLEGRQGHARGGEHMRLQVVLERQRRVQLEDVLGDDVAAGPAEYAVGRARGERWARTPPEDEIGAEVSGWCPG